MFVPFDSLPSSSRIWIYQSDRKFSSSEKEILSEALSTFTEQWQVHGQPMKTSFAVLHDQFIVLAADEDFNSASGCSIDGSVRLLKEMGNQLGMDFFNRNLVAFKKEKETILIPVKDLNKKRIEGTWDENTFVFNNLVSSIETLNKNWIAPAGTTWLKRYLTGEKIIL